MAQNPTAFYHQCTTPTAGPDSDRGSRTLAVDRSEFTDG